MSKERNACLNELKKYEACLAEKDAEIDLLRRRIELGSSDTNIRTQMAEAKLRAQVDSLQRELNFCEKRRAEYEARLTQRKKS